MRPLEAHCRAGLGRLYQRTGRGEAAERELAAAAAAYRAMGMTAERPVSAEGGCLG
ncbi:MAG TPA: hypothetical protein VGX21_15285 [Methylomirabilota bacterium]|nr:hypothetical protein [Methylomirabilota bacterium]